MCTRSGSGYSDSLTSSAAPGFTQTTMEMDTLEAAITSLDINGLVTNEALGQLPRHRRQEGRANQGFTGKGCQPRRAVLPSQHGAYSRTDGDRERRHRRSHERPSSPRTWRENKKHGPLPSHGKEGEELIDTLQHQPWFVHNSAVQRRIHEKTREHTMTQCWPF